MWKIRGRSRGDGPVAGMAAPGWAAPGRPAAGRATAGPEGYRLFIASRFFLHRSLPREAGRVREGADRQGQPQVLTPSPLSFHPADRTNRVPDTMWCSPTSLWVADPLSSLTVPYPLVITP